MTVRHDFPFEIEVFDPVWVALSDGTRLALTIWRPKTAGRVPAVVEMIPYRRRDGTVFRDMEIHPYLAGYGIAAVRVDIRGTGDSDGDLLDEYLPGEQEDAVEIIAWIAAQPWCNGSVGMTGISWGGFNSLQVAARRPPALKAIIPVCATDDRYADDVHYMGGALITEDAMWSNYMLAKGALPPDPRIVGPRWREMWRRRIETNHSWSEHWMAHQRRDEYWKQGSVCENYSAITCAVLAVCGWEDSYSNFVGRLLEGLSCPRQAIMGVWTHTYPCRGTPGPNIGYIQEAIRWWKYWLAGEDTGIMDEPMYRIWITGEERPRPWYAEHAGGWAAESAWPPPRIQPTTLYLNDAKLAGEPDSGPAIGVRSPATAGTDCGRWGGYGGICPDMPIDQRREDGQGLCFDSDVLDGDLVLMGGPELFLVVTVDQPHVTLTARLCDVYPDGTSAMMTYGLLNLSHRDSHDDPSPCPVGEPFRIRLKLNDFARRIPAGHRLRLALATQHWPIVWPQPGLPMLRLKSGEGKVILPVRPANPADAKVRFEQEEIAPPVPTTELAPSRDKRTVTDDVGSGIRTIDLESDHGRTRIDDRNTEVGSWNRDVFRIHPDDPTTAELVTECRLSMRSGDADVDSYSRTVLTADAGHFYLTWNLEVREGGRLIETKGATRHIRRDFA